MGELLDKASGQVVDVPDDKMGEFFATGKFRARPGTRIPVVSADGRVGTITAETFAASPEGYRVASAADIDERRKQRAYGEGVGSAAQTIVEGAARGASVGLSDAAAVALGADAEAMRERQERRPGLAIGAEIVSGIAPMLVTGGASAAVGTGARVLRAVGAASRGVARVGRVAETGAAAVLGGTRLARAVGVGTGAAAEGVIYGAGQAVSRAALHGDDLTVEQLVASSASGALLGGGTGLALHAAARAIAAGGRLASAGASKVGSALRRADVAPPSAAAVDDAMSAAGARVRGAGSDAGALAVAAPDESGFAAVLSGRKATRELEAVQDASARTLARSGDDAFHSFDQILDRITMAQKWKAVGRAIEKDAMPLEAIAVDADGVIGQIRMTADEVLTNRGGAFEPREVAAVRALSKRIDHAQTRLEKAFIEGAEGDARQEIFETIDVLKKQLGSTAGRLPGHEGGAGEMFRERYDILAKHLENEGLYGAAASAIQREDNQRWTALFDVWSPFKRMFGVDAGGKRFGTNFERSLRFGTEQAESFVRSAHTAGAGTKREIFDRYMSTSSDLLSQLVKSHESGPALRALADEYATATAKMRKSVVEAEITAQRVAKHRALEAEVGLWPGALPTFRTAVGLTERVASASSAPTTAVAGVRTIRERAAAATEKTAKAVTAFFERSKRAAPVAATIVAGDATRATLTERYERKRSRVQELAASPARVISEVAEHMGDTHRVAPHLTAAYAAAQARGVSFLAGVLPRGYSRDSELRPDLDARARVDPGAMAKWLRYARAVEDPASVIADLARHDLSPESAEALRAVYPQMFAQLRDQIATHVATADAPPAYGQLVQLSILFGTPLHPSMEPGFIAMVQQRYAERGQPGSEGSAALLSPSARSAPQTSDAYATKSERVSA